MKNQLMAVTLLTGAALVATHVRADSPDKAFIEKAAKGGMAEVEIGKVAQDKAGNAQVKAFAGRMVTDHSKANEELKSIAEKKSVALPSGPDAEQKKHGEKLKSLSGAAFDREYMTHMVGDHKATVADFEKEAASGKDPDVKAFAAKTLPTLRDHLKEAQATHDAVAKNK